MRAATGGLADVRIVRGEAEFEPHDGEMVFGFVLAGSAQLVRGGASPIGPADAFVIPPGERWSLSAASDDFRLLYVTTGRLRQFA